MTGREVFRRTKPIILILSKAVCIFPKKLRRILFYGMIHTRGKYGILMRYVFLKSIAKSVGDNVVIFPGVYFEHPENLMIGSNVSIHQMSYIDASGGISIGNDVSIAHRCTILSTNHIYNQTDSPIKYQGMINKETVIEDNVWIGCSCVILCGAHIETGCVIGANSTVNKRIEADSLAFGSPAKRVSSRIHS